MRYLLFTLLILMTAIWAFNVRAVENPASDPALKEAILGKLAENGITDPVVLEHLRVSPLHVQLQHPVILSDFALKDKAGQFSGLIAGDQGALVITIKGQYADASSIPVLKHGLSVNQAIGKDDIAWLEVPKRIIHTDMVTDASDLIGKLPRRFLKDNTPLHKTDIAAAILIKKGETVTMYYRSGSMELKTTGIAMQDGSAGEIITLHNTRSKLAVQGKVFASGEVVVSPMEAKFKPEIASAR